MADKQEILWGLLQHEANKKCMDCHVNNPLFACINTGTFICASCAQIHRTDLGHTIKPISGVFNDDEIRWFQSQGNAVARRKWLGRWSSSECIEPSSEDVARFRQFLITTYADKKWVLEKPLPPLPLYGLSSGGPVPALNPIMPNGHPHMISPRNISPRGGTSGLVQPGLFRENSAPNLAIAGNVLENEFVELALTKEKAVNNIMASAPAPVTTPLHPVDFTSTPLTDASTGAHPVVHFQPPSPQLIDISSVIPNPPIGVNGLASGAAVRSLLDLTPVKDMSGPLFPENAMPALATLSNPFIDPSPPVTLASSNPFVPPAHVSSNPFIEPAPVQVQATTPRQYTQSGAPNGPLTTSDPAPRSPRLNPFHSAAPPSSSAPNMQQHNNPFGLMDQISSAPPTPSAPAPVHPHPMQHPHMSLHNQAHLSSLPGSTNPSPAHTPLPSPLPSPAIPRHAISSGHHIPVSSSPIPTQGTAGVAPDGSTPHQNGVTPAATANSDELKMLEEVRALKQLYEMGMMDKGEYDARRIQLVNALTRTSHSSTPSQSTAVSIPSQIPDPRLAGTERAIRHRYDAKKLKWCHTATIVIIEPTPFAEGAMRKAYRMRDLSQEGPASQMVCKMFKDPSEDRTTYFREVEMQMQAKEIAERFNRRNPPKKVDFVTCFVMELVDRPPVAPPPTASGGPPSGPPLRQICSVEYFIDGKYEKHNNNYGYKNEHDRNTPQAFSHFSYEDSNCQLIVVDIQGVGDMYTDPQIHSADGQGYGKGNLGVEGINKFFSTHNCNQICYYLGLNAINPKPLSDCGTKPQPAPSLQAHPQQGAYSQYDPRLGFQSDPFDLLRNPQHWPKSNN
eukprot:TRINITY_DN10622_c0_g1_i5.p2 TRINITY_DN10622_c0_g1~~TRINITY_DN10622_c0_g1_i5.p2  ORF type:complete len:845 (-),score=200.72 TRINITY_DN10622_c0_g1_i5:73-2607(-)